jgi:hypothetical protein
VDEVFIPLQPHFLALHGLSKLLETINLVSVRLNPRLKISGVVLCMYDVNTRLAGEVSENVEQFFQSGRDKTTPWSGAHTFQTRIRRNVRLAEAPSFGQSIFQYSPDSHGAWPKRSRRSCKESPPRRSVTLRAFRNSPQRSPRPIPGTPRRAFATGPRYDRNGRNSRAIHYLPHHAAARIPFWSGPFFPVLR